MTASLVNLDSRERVKDTFTGLIDAPRAADMKANANKMSLESMSSSRKSGRGWCQESERQRCLLNSYLSSSWALQGSPDQDSDAFLSWLSSTNQALFKQAPRTARPLSPKNARYLASHSLQRVAWSVLSSSDFCGISECPIKLYTPRSCTDTLHTLLVPSSLEPLESSGPVASGLLLGRVLRQALHDHRRDHNFTYDATEEVPDRAQIVTGDSLTNTLDLCTGSV